MKAKRGKVFVLIGPTAVGKNTLLDALCGREADLVRMPSATTRPPREGEISGVSKVFLSDEQFDEAIEKDEFVEWQVIHGYRYGVLKRIINERIEQGRDYIADIEVLGAMKLKECYQDDVVLIFIVPPSFEALQQRISNRGTEDDATKALRLSRSKAELTFLPQCDYVVMNDDLTVAIETMTSVIRSERSGLSERHSSLATASATVLLVTEDRNSMLVTKDLSLLASLTIVLDRETSIDKKISRCLASQSLQGNLLTDSQFDETQNKGLDIPQPLWVEFSLDATNSICVQFIYVARISNIDPERYQSQPIDLITAAQAQHIPMDRERFLKELARYV